MCRSLWLCIISERHAGRSLRFFVHHDPFDRIIFDEDAVAHGGVVDKAMGHRTDELAVLNDRRAGHLCVKDRTKIFTNLFVNYASGEIPEAF